MLRRQGVVSVSHVSHRRQSGGAVFSAFVRDCISPNHIVGVCLDDTSTLTARIHQSLKGQTRMHPKNTKNTVGFDSFLVSKQRLEIITPNVAVNGLVFPPCFPRPACRFYSHLQHVPAKSMCVVLWGGGGVCEAFVGSALA